MDAEDARPRAIVVDPGVDPGLLVARVGLVERWQKALGALGHEVVVTPPAGLSAALAAAGQRRDPLGEAPGWTLVVWAEWVVDPASLDSFRDELVGMAEVTAVARLEIANQGGAPVLGIAPAFASAIAAGLDADAAANAKALLAHAARHGEVHAVRLEAGHFERVTDAASAARAVRGLLARLRWRQGGVVAHYLNRPVSSVISRWLANTTVTPNQTTIVTFLIGIVGIVLLVRPGGHWGAFAGMAILHANSVLDGVDGELARLRYESSSFGAYLDSVCDEILNTAMLIAVGYNLAHDPSHGWSGYQALGIFAGVVSFTYASVHWHCKWKHGLGLYWWWDAYKPRKTVQASNSTSRYLMRLFQKDGLLFMALVASAVGLLPALLWISAIASAAVTVLLFVHIVVKRARW